MTVIVTAPDGHKIHVSDENHEKLKRYVEDVLDERGLTNEEFRQAYADKAQELAMSPAQVARFEAMRDKVRKASGA